MQSSLLACGDAKVLGTKARESPAIHVEHCSTPASQAMHTAMQSKDHGSEKITAEGAENTEANKGHELGQYTTHTQATKIMLYNIHLIA